MYTYIEIDREIDREIEREIDRERERERERGLLKKFKGELGDVQKAESNEKHAFEMEEHLMLCCYL